MPQLDISSYFSQVFWLVICLFILFFLFKNVFVPNMDNILLKRTEFFEKSDAEVEKVEKEALDMLHQVESIKAEALQISSKIIEDAINKSEKMIGDQERSAKMEYDGMIAATRSRMNEEIKSINTTFKIQIDMNAQAIVDNIFLKRS